MWNGRTALVRRQITGAHPAADTCDRGADAASLQDFLKKAGATADLTNMPAHARWWVLVGPEREKAVGVHRFSASRGVYFTLNRAAYVWFEVPGVVAAIRTERDWELVSLPADGVRAGIDDAEGRAPQDRHGVDKVSIRPGPLGVCTILVAGKPLATPGPDACWAWSATDGGPANVLVGPWGQVSAYLDSWKAGPAPKAGTLRVVDNEWIEPDRELLGTPELLALGGGATGEKLRSLPGGPLFPVSSTQVAGLLTADDLKLHGIDPGPPTLPALSGWRIRAVTRGALLGARDLRVGCTHFELRAEIALGSEAARKPFGLVLSSPELPEWRRACLVRPVDSSTWMLTGTVVAGDPLLQRAARGEGTLELRATSEDDPLWRPTTVEVAPVLGLTSTADPAGAAAIRGPLGTAKFTVGDMVPRESICLPGRLEGIAGARSQSLSVGWLIDGTGTIRLNPPAVAAIGVLHAHWAVGAILFTSRGPVLQGRRFLSLCVETGWAPVASGVELPTGTRMVVAELSSGTLWEGSVSLVGDAPVASPPLPAQLAGSSPPLFECRLRTDDLLAGARVTVNRPGDGPQVIFQHGNTRLQGARLVLGGLPGSGAVTVPALHGSPYLGEVGWRAGQTPNVNPPEVAARTDAGGCMLRAGPKTVELRQARQPGGSLVIQSLTLTAPTVVVNLGSGAAAWLG